LPSLLPGKVRDELFKVNQAFQVNGAPDGSQVNCMALINLSLVISSGPVEAAHRTVLQVRMNTGDDVDQEASGQRWSERGCDRMVLLRAAYKREKFHLITDLFRQQNYQCAAQVSAAKF
jgi:hypothetical protein